MSFFYYKKYSQLHTNHDTFWLLLGDKSSALSWSSIGLLLPCSSDFSNLFPVFVSKTFWNTYTQYNAEMKKENFQ
jgi:hypothetical protein